MGTETDFVCEIGVCPHYSTAGEIGVSPHYSTHTNSLTILQ
jgi:hypothetical protein